MENTEVTSQAQILFDLQDDLGWVDSLMQVMVFLDLLVFFFWNLLVSHNAGTYDFERDLFPKMTSYQSRGQNSKLRLTNIHFVAGT